MVVSNNNLRDITPYIRRLNKLKVLKLQNNPNLTSLPNFIWKMPALEKIVVDSELIKCVPQNAEITLVEDSKEVYTFSFTLKNQRRLNKEELMILLLKSIKCPLTVCLKKKPYIKSMLKKKNILFHI